MRISDWSSDVCSSDLITAGEHLVAVSRRVEEVDRGAARHAMPVWTEIDGNVIFPHAIGGMVEIVHGFQQERYMVQFGVIGLGDKGDIVRLVRAGKERRERCAGLVIQIGRASCRARVCQYV